MRGYEKTKENNHAAVGSNPNKSDAPTLALERIPTQFPLLHVYKQTHCCSLTWRVSLQCFSAHCTTKKG